MKNDFINNIDPDTLYIVNDKLDILSNTDASETDINDVTENICNIFIDCAKKIGSIKTNIVKIVKNTVKNRKKSTAKPWYNEKCRQKRNNYYKTKRNLRSYNSDVNVL